MSKCIGIYLVLENLNATDQKILNASLGVDKNLDLDKIILTADSMVVAQVGMIGAVTGLNEIRDETGYAKPRENFRGPRSGEPLQPKYNENQDQQGGGSHGYLVCGEPRVSQTQDPWNIGQTHNGNNQFGKQQPLRDITREYDMQNNIENIPFNPQAQNLSCNEIVETAQVPPERGPKQREQGPRGQDA